MRKYLMILLAVMLLFVAVFAGAQTLPVDSRKKEMQFYRDYEYREIAPTDTVWTKVVLPKGCVSVWAYSVVDSVAVGRDSTYTLASNVTTGVPGMIITKRESITFPTIRQKVIWVRRAAKATASKVRLIFYIM